MSDKEDENSVIQWSTKQVEDWLIDQCGDSLYNKYLIDQQIDGRTLLMLNEQDFYTEPLFKLPLGIRKRLYINCRLLQKDNYTQLSALYTSIRIDGIQTTAKSNNSDYTPQLLENNNSTFIHSNDDIFTNHHYNHHHINNNNHHGQMSSNYNCSTSLKPEKVKAFLSLVYVIGVTWITAFVMVIVHDRVPDMEKYPPLPDIFLDNVPLIPWAFDMCEVTGTFLFTMWLVVLIFHKHRFILMRRFFALSGTVFLLRCVTMIITSLSVPGTHLQCQPRMTYAARNMIFADLATKLKQAYIIWRGAGLSIQGVRTCGDYMFSGHTVALTMLNFFITEYTSRNVYYIHILSWMLNMFGIFFILAAHEHYSIDVFVAFYITSRLFLYYHTLSNNQALMQRDSNRTKIWFPLFSYFESTVDGIVPNEYETPTEIVLNLLGFLKENIIALVALIPIINNNNNNNNRNGNNSSDDKDNEKKSR